MKKISFIASVWSLSVLAFLITSCTLHGDGQGLSILDNSICSIPCWNGITPGETTMNEALDIIMKINLVDQTSIVKVETSSKVYSTRIDFKLKPNLLGGKNDIQVEVAISNDKVVDVAFWGPLGIYFGDIATNHIPSNVFSLTLPGDYNIVTVLAPKDGIVFQNQSYDANPNLSENTPIHALFLFSRESFDSLLDEGMFSSSVYNASEVSKIMYPWRGYGYLSQIYPPRLP